MNRVNVGNVLIDNISLSETLDKVEALIAKGEPCYVVNPNVDIIVKYNHDKDLARFYDKAALTLVDGTPVLWAAKFFGEPLKEKISGSDFVPRICELSAEKGYRIFFLGGREGAAVKAKEVMEARYSGTKIVGTYCPPMGFENDEAECQRIFDAVKDAKPDILFVGLGSPKQDRWIEKYHQLLGVPVSMGIGVTFEFIAGMVQRAPKWMQKNGLEWSWRLAMEPRRLWKRYLVDDVQFLPIVLKQKFQNRHSERTRRIS